MARSVVLLPLFAAVAAPLGAQSRREFTEVHLGVPVRLVFYAPADSMAPPAARAAFARIAELEDKMSDYRPTSEVRRLEGRVGEWVPVSDELFTVLAQALEIARASEGAFDPTAGPVVALWREARRTGRLPLEGALDSARALVGWNGVELDNARRAVRLTRPGTRLDLGGIAKGFILQQALERLRASGVRSALLEGGGDIVVGDPPPGAGGWRIDVPGADQLLAGRAAALANAAVATSGPTEQFVDIGGVRYSHVVDPRSGRALSDGQVATVIARDAAIADALATALTVLGTERGAVLLARYPGTLGSLREARSETRVR